VEQHGQDRNNVVVSQRRNTTRSLQSFVTDKHHHLI
jgi:hypothetical protein